MGKKVISKEQKDTADRIYNIRIGLGYSQAQFAKILDVACSTYKKIEKGESGVTVYQLRRLNQYLGISGNYLLFGDRTNMDETWLSVQNLSEKDKLRIFLRLHGYMKETCRTVFKEEKEWKKQDAQAGEVMKLLGVDSESASKNKKLWK